MGGVQIGMTAVAVGSWQMPESDDRDDDDSLIEQIIELHQELSTD